MHPDQIIERMELVLLRAIFVEAKTKPLARDHLTDRSWKPDDIWFEFSLINEQESNLSFERQRELLTLMHKAGTIKTYYDGPDEHWDKVKSVWMTVQLKTLEARYALLSRKHPDKGFLWYRSPDVNSATLDKLEEDLKFDYDAPYEFKHLRQDRNKKIRYGKIPLPLPDHLRLILVYFMAKPGYHSDKDIFSQLHPLSDFLAGSIKTMQKYISAINRILGAYTDIKIVRCKYPEANGYEMVQVKERRSKPKVERKK